MSINEPEVIFDDDNPEWTEEDFARALKPHEIPPEILAAFPKMRGRPTGSTKPDPKVQVSLRIDPDVLAAFKASGAGWQSRMNAALRAAAPKSQKSAAS
ncbi:MAG: BrnA antitoxin family protein [Pseudomonadota bacterium]